VRVQALFVLVAVTFAGLYFQNTTHWSPADFESYVAGTMQYPQALGTFRTRVLMPWVGRAVLAIPGADPAWTFRAVAVFCGWGILLAYRAFLGEYVRRDAAAGLATLIAWPLLWNYCLLNRLYFPFDLPAILLTLLGCLAIRRRVWVATYAILALATLNRETGGFLIAVFAVCEWGRLSRGRWLGHLATQLALWAGIVIGLRAAYGGGADLSSLDWLRGNAQTLLDMLALRGNALKDWAKLVLAFGGAWWLIPPAWRRLPDPVRRLCLAAVPLLIATAYRGILDEVRVYGELIPVVATPGILWLAQKRGLAVAEIEEKLG